MLQRLVDAYPEDVQIVYRHFPLTSIHALAQKAGEASEAAGAQGVFWEYHDLLFERQQEWAQLPAEEARNYFIDLANELGLDISQFTADLDGDVYADYVDAQRQEAMNLGMGGTPSAIFQGQLLTGNGMPGIADWIWDALVQLELLTARQYNAPPPLTIDTDAAYSAVVEMASGDSFTIELLPQSAPETVNNFIFLAQEGWFDGITFHRVLPGFVAQTGDPTGTGFGGPGYFISTEIDESLSHSEEGVVAMANSGEDRNGSQWYVTLGDVSQLDGGYSIFGRVVEGMDVVQGLTPRDPSQNPEAPPGDRIETVTIIEE